MYDDTGKLVGHEGFGLFGSSCESYDPAFVPSTVCIPLAGKCSPDAGLTEAGTSNVSCPGTAGPTMVRVPAPDGTPYCIDSTEVTNRQYAEFLSAKKSGADGGTDTSGQLPECSWNATYTPFSKWPATGRDEFPVIYVDWCDASAYCKWAGKRLCGKIGGGSNAEADFADPAKSQWFNACSQGGTETYPYGSTYDATACIGEDYDGVPGWQAGSDVEQPVAIATRCHGRTSPFDGIYDLSGSVAEWEDSCRATSPKIERCRVRGGSFVHWSTTLGCGADLDYYQSGGVANIGIRCCGE